ncbi:MAG: ribulose-phosphate 3-epimerase [Planctomycetota bacterium]
MRTVLTDPPRLPLIAPSLLAADSANLERDARGLLDAGADVLHIDVMDGHFVPNINFGPAVVAALRRALPDACLDVHLMIEEPGRYLDAFLEAGSDLVSVHVEVCEGEGVARGLARRIQDAGAAAGLALNPGTPIEAILPDAEAFDMILLMGVQPGFGGQSIDPHTASRARTIRAAIGSGVRLEVDGGVTAQNATALTEAGIDVVVAGTAILGRPEGEWPGLIEAIRGDVVEGPCPDGL